MTLEERIEALQANVDASRARNQMALDNGQFSLDSARTYAEIDRQWVKLQMDWNLHAAEIVKKSIENAKSNEQLKQMQYAFDQFRSEYRYQLKQRSHSIKRIKRWERHVRLAERVFEGEVNGNAWKAFGKLAIRSRIILPATDGTPFDMVYPTKAMTMYQLGKFCFGHRVTLNLVSSEFEYVHQAFLEINDSVAQRLTSLTEALGGVIVKLDALKESQFEGLFEGQ